MDIHLKRIYEPRDPADGYRVLVDRLWPRGVKKSDAGVDHWAKDLAPSTELRTWLHQDRSRFDSFRWRYLQELNANQAAALALIAQVPDRDITLLTAARDTACSHVVVLREFLVELQDSPDAIAST